LISGDGEWDEEISKLETANPTRRDTFMMRTGGYVILTFYTDKVWLLHCHIAWHASERLSTSLFVRKNDMKPNLAVGKNI
jgi:FtsP/CotA-like multicopper oxidase with cupredoxin domain